MKDKQQMIQEGKTVLGIEFGSTRIKAVLLGEDNSLLAVGSCEWENRFEDGVWTYREEEIWQGLRTSYRDMADNVQKIYGVAITQIGAMGFSGMMHGYLPFNAEGELLVPFRTWRNTMTEEAAAELTKRFGFNIPQRWSIAHLYQAVLHREPHLEALSYLTTLAGYVHWRLTGKKVLGVGEASGMFPIDSQTKQYDQKMLDIFDTAVAERHLPWKIREILPEVLKAGEKAGVLTAEGAKLLDPSGCLQPGTLLCPPEGDAGTGMVATNSVKPRTGNVSAGTSVFAMVVLEKGLKKLHPELDLVTTPEGDAAAMVHCNNCSSELNAWVNLFDEFAVGFGMEIPRETLFSGLFRKALEGEADGGGLLAYNYLSGEHITGFEKGCPLFVRTPESRFNLANFMRAQLLSSMSTLKIGLDILVQEENVQIDTMTGHGGIFETPEVGQRLMAAAVGAPVTVHENAGEGGAWGIALLASYMMHREEYASLAAFLRMEIFAGQDGVTLNPDPADAEGFAQFSARYRKGLAIERSAVSVL